VHVEKYGTGSNDSPVEVSKLIATAIICAKNALKKKNI
jgi:hypothetical protein